MKRLLPILLFSASLAAKCLPIDQAGKHIGDTQCVTGKVLSVSAPYLNFCDDYRTCPFSVQIRGFDPESLKGKTVQFTGRIYVGSTGRASMFVADPQQAKAIP